MKPLHTEEYYLSQWERFLDPMSTPHCTPLIHCDNYINLEGDLAHYIEEYKQLGIPEAALPTLEQMEAKKLAERGREICMRQLKVQKELDAGTATFGYTTHRQEIEARADFRNRFEFNCIQLKLFKQNHNL